MSMLHRHRWVAGAVAGAAILSGLVSAGSAVAAPGRSAIPGTHPDWAVSRAGHQAPAVTSGAVNLRVYLAGQDPAGLAAYATAVSDPTSASYGNYLTPAQAQARFGTTSAQIQAVESWLKGAGLTVTGVTSGAGGYVSVTGTVAEASQAFGVSFANYTDPTRSDGAGARSRRHRPELRVRQTCWRCPASTPASHQMKPGDTLPPPGPNYWVAPPTSTYYGSKIATNEPTANGQHWPWTVGGYTPQQIRGAYNVSNSGMTGRGQTVAIVDAYASPTMLSDANEFSRVTGNRPFRPGQYQQYLPSTFTLTANSDECGAQGWYGEETLDVESVHDMAPDANVHFVAGASCHDTDLFAADALIVNDGLASIVSNSFGEPYDDATIQSAWDQVFEYGAIEGIGFMFSSGDSGYEDPDDRGSRRLRPAPGRLPDLEPMGHVGRWHQRRDRAERTTGSGRSRGERCSTRWRRTVCHGRTRLRPRTTPTPMTARAAAA